MATKKTNGACVRSGVISGVQLLHSAEQSSSASDGEALTARKLLIYYPGRRSSGSIDVARLFQRLLLQAELADSPFIVEIRANTPVRIVKTAIG